MSTVATPRQFAAPPMARLVRVELRKMVDTRSGRWLLIAATMITIGLAILLAFVADTEDVDFNPLIEICWLPLAILLSIVGILSATGEWSQRTSLTTFALVPQRERIVAAKLLGAVLLGVAAMVISMFAAGIGTAVAGGEWNLNMSHVTEGLLLLELSILGGVAFGLLFMSPAIAIVASFVLPTVFAILGEIRSLQDTWEWLDPASAQEPLNNANAHGDDWGKLAVSTLVWVVLPAVAGLLRTMRREAK